MKRHTLLAGKTVVITGSTKGIGRATAQACAKAGANIVFNSRTAEDIDRVCSEHKNGGFPASGCRADISREEDLMALFQHAIDRWGRIDVWINNAGLSGGYRYVQDLSPGEIGSIVDSNLKGTLLACRLLIPYFCQNDGGTLLNISGRGGKSEPAPYLATYAATKAAVSSLTRSLARENQNRPLSIHSIIPGMVDTGFYSEVPTSEDLRNDMSHIRFVLNAFGMPEHLVGRRIAAIAAQKPGRRTGRQYYLLGPGRMARGIALMSWYGLRGSLK